MARTSVYDAYVDGLNDVMRALRKFPKEASADLRTASVLIADRHMVPAWRDAASNYAGPWGDAIAASVRAKRDRVPSVSIGSAKRVFSGGASATMVRAPANRGTRGRAGQAAAAFGQGTDWIVQAKGYVPAAMREWSQAVDRVCAKWSVM